MVSHPSPRLGSEDDVLGRRIAATLIDTSVVFGIYTGLLTTAGVITRGFGPPLSIVNFFVWFVLNVLGLAPLVSLHGSSLVWFLSATFTWALYAAVCETVRGQTIGKLITGIVVVQIDGSACGPVAAIVRNLLRVVDGFLYYFVGLLILGLSSDRQRLGDHLAGTLVVGVSGRD